MFDLVRLGGGSCTSFDGHEAVWLPLIADADCEAPITSQALALDTPGRQGEGELVTVEDEADGGDVVPPVGAGEAYVGQPGSRRDEGSPFVVGHCCHECVSFRGDSSLTGAAAWTCGESGGIEKRQRVALNPSSLPNANTCAGSTA